LVGLEGESDVCFRADCAPWFNQNRVLLHGNRPGPRHAHLC
jgi:hypothetical protein